MSKRTQAQRGYSPSSSAHHYHNTFYISVDVLCVCVCVCVCVCICVCVCLYLLFVVANKRHLSNFYHSIHVCYMSECLPCLCTFSFVVIHLRCLSISQLSTALSPSVRTLSLDSRHKPMQVARFSLIDTGFFCANPVKTELLLSAEASKRKLREKESKGVSLNCERGRKARLRYLSSSLWICVNVYLAVYTYIHMLVSLFLAVGVVVHV